MSDIKAIPTRKNMSQPARIGLEHPITDQDAPADSDPLGFDQPPPAPTAVTLSTVVEYRGRQITVTASNMTVDRFCDLLDRRGFATPAATQEWRTLPDGTPICPKHGTPMRLREKQGDSWYSHQIEGAGGSKLYCKGYAGKDSPGYDH